MHTETVPLYPSATSQVKENFSVGQSSPTAPAQAYTPAPQVLLGAENTATTCPFCHASVKTAVKYVTTSRTHIAAAICALVCCCCCIPYCSDSAKNTDHFCPNCQKYLGTYQK